MRLPSAYRTLALALLLLFTSVHPALAVEGSKTGLGAGFIGGNLAGQLAYIDGGLTARLFGGGSAQSFSFKDTDVTTSANVYLLGATVGYRKSVERNVFIHISGIASFSETAAPSLPTTKLRIIELSYGGNISVAFWPTDDLEFLFVPLEVMRIERSIGSGHAKLRGLGTALRGFNTFVMTYYF